MLEGYPPMLDIFAMSSPQMLDISATFDPLIPDKIEIKVFLFIFLIWLNLTKFIILTTMEGTSIHMRLIAFARRLSSNVGHFLVVQPFNVGHLNYISSFNARQDGNFFF